MTSPRELAGEAPEKGMRLVSRLKFSEDGTSWVVDRSWWVRNSDIRASLEMTLEEYMDAYSPNKEWRLK